MKPFDVRARDAREKLLEQALKSAYGLGYDLKKHPQRGEAVRLLEEVGVQNGVWRPEVIEVLAVALPDSARTVTHFLEAVREQPTWEGVDRVLSSLRYFEALQLQACEGLEKLYSGALAGGGPITLPLGRPTPRPAAPSGPLARLKGLLAKPAPAPQGRDPDEFRKKYLNPVERQLEHLRARGATRPAGPGGTASTAPLRTRQQRIDEMMAGGPLNDELFLVLTSREDGYANLKRLLERRRDALAGLTRPRFGLKLDAAQFRELWELLPADLQAGFGVDLIHEARSALGREEALQLLRHPSAKVVERVLYDLPNTALPEDTALAHEVIRRHPQLAQGLRRHFLCAIPPSKGELPVWERRFTAPDPLNVLVLPQHVLISTPQRLESLGSVTGELEWAHEGNLPLLFHAAGPGRFVGEHGAHACLVKVGPARLEQLVFGNQRFAFEAGDMVSSGSSAVGLYRSDDYSDGEHYRFDLLTLELHNRVALDDREQSESRLLCSRWRQPHQAVRCGSGHWVWHYERKGFYAVEQADEPGELDLTFTENYMFGLETRGEARTLRCWVL